MQTMEMMAIRDGMLMWFVAELPYQGCFGGVLCESQFAAGVQQGWRFETEQMGRSFSFSLSVILYGWQWDILCLLRISGNRLST